VKDELKFIYRVILPVLSLEDDSINNYVVVKSYIAYPSIKPWKQMWSPGHQWTILDKINNRCDNIGTMQDFINNL